MSKITMKRYSKLKNKAGRPKEGDDIFPNEVEQANVRSILYRYLDQVKYGDFVDVRKLVKFVINRFEEMTGLPIEVPENLIVIHLIKYHNSANFRKLQCGFYIKEKLKK